MIKISDLLYVGNAEDYEREKYRGIARTAGDETKTWWFVQACREPYHREALQYTGRGAPKEHPEYLSAIRMQPMRLIMNLIDADDPKWIPEQLIRTAIDFMADADAGKHPVLVHCNQGKSRAPAIALWWQAIFFYPSNWHYEAAVYDFQLMYPDYQPAAGMRGFLEQHWPNRKQWRKAL